MKKKSPINRGIDSMWNCSVSHGKQMDTLVFACMCCYLANTSTGSQITHFLLVRLYIKTCMYTLDQPNGISLCCNKANYLQ